MKAEQALKSLRNVPRFSCDPGHSPCRSGEALVGGKFPAYLICNRLSPLDDRADPEAQGPFLASDTDSRGLDKTSRTHR